MSKKKEVKKPGKAVQKKSSGNKKGGIPKGPAMTKKVVEEHKASAKDSKVARSSLPTAVRLSEREKARLTIMLQVAYPAVI